MFVSKVTKYAVETSLRNKYHRHIIRVKTIPNNLEFKSMFMSRWMIAHFWFCPKVMDGEGQVL